MFGLFKKKIKQEDIVIKKGDFKLLDEMLKEERISQEEYVDMKGRLAEDDVRISIFNIPDGEGYEISD